jgi:hypothetical protein
MIQSRQKVCTHVLVVFGSVNGILEARSTDTPVV